MFAVKNTYPVYVMKYTLPKINKDSNKLESSSSDTILDYLQKDKVQSNLFVELVTMLLRNFKTLGYVHCTELYGYIVYIKLNFPCGI